MKQKVLYAIIAVLAVAAIVFGALYFTNDADKTAQIDKLTGEKTALMDDVNGKAGQIATLEGEKIQLIADHEKALGEKDVEIAKLTEVVAGKDSQIATLEGEKAQLIADLVGQAEYADYVAAPLDTYVEVETYVQAKQSWWDNKATFYTQNIGGAYFIYEMPISEEDFNKLVPGTKIRVAGYKAEWAGDVEIVDATFEILEGNWIAEPKDVTSLLGTENLIAYQNQLVAFKGVTIEEIEYKNGEPGDDIYVTVSYEGNNYYFCVERYLTGPETEVYQAVCMLQAGDVVDIEGFLYWYNGASTHITKVTAVQ